MPWHRFAAANLAADLADLCCRWLLFAGKHVNTEELLRQHVVPWGQRPYPDGKYAFWWIQHRPTLLKPPIGFWQNSGFQQNSGFRQIGRHICET
jgi:hypothetical protein